MRSANKTRTGKLWWKKSFSLNSPVLFAEPSPCYVDQVYDRFVLFFIFPQRVKDEDFAYISQDNKENPVEPVNTCRIMSFLRYTM